MEDKNDMKVSNTGEEKKKKRIKKILVDNADFGQLHREQSLDNYTDNNFWEVIHGPV